MAKRNWLKVEGYDDILDSLTFSQSDDSQSLIAVRISDEQSVTGMDPFQAVDVWLPSEHVQKLDDLRNLIRKGLEELGHPASGSVVDSLLPLIVLTPGRGRRRLAYLFSRFRTTLVTQTLVLPFQFEGEASEVAERAIRIGEFSLKAFDSSQKISAAFAARSPLGIDTAPLEEMDGCWSIERALDSVPYCDVGDYERILQVATSQVIPEIRDMPQKAGAAELLGQLFYQNYGTQYDMYLRDRFFNDFRDAQSSHVALGGSLFPIQAVLGLDGCLFVDQWHEASFNASRGVMHATVVTGGMLMKLGSQFGDFLASFDQHRALGSQLGAGALRRSPALRTFTRLIVMAREQAQEGRLDVAFLLCCTALEYVMVGSTAEPIARTLSRRLGALHALSADVSFEDAVKECQRLYDTRSQFVHKANPIGSEDLDRLLELCTLVYSAAVRISLRKSTMENDRWTKRWHVALDYVGSSLAAGATVDASIAADAGIQVLNDVSSSAIRST